MRNALLLVFPLIGFPVIGLAPLAAQETSLVKAGRLVLAPDTVLENEAFLIRGGKVAYAGKEIPEEAKSGAHVIDCAGKTVVPGIFAAVPYCIDLIGGPYIETNELVCAAFRPKAARRVKPNQPL